MMLSPEWIVWQQMGILSKKVFQTCMSLFQICLSIFPGLKHVVWCGDICVWAGLIWDLLDTSSHFLVWPISQKWFRLCQHSSNQIMTVAKEVLPRIWTIYGCTGLQFPAQAIINHFWTNNNLKSYNQLVPEANRQYWSN